MNSTERPRSLRLQQQQQQQQLIPIPLKTKSRFSRVRSYPEPTFTFDMDEDTNINALYSLSPPRKHALRTCTRGYVAKVTIGPDHQVDVPDYVPLDNARTYRDDGEVETLIWSPNGTNSESQLMLYMTMATRSKNNYSVEQAIAMLQAHQHDYGKALEQVSCYANTKAIWSTSERQRFDQLLAQHGGQFNRIKEAMPWKSLAEIIDYYFSWESAQIRLSFPQQVLAWRAKPTIQSANSCAPSTVLDKTKPVSLTPSKKKSPQPPLKDAELLVLAQDNSSAWPSIDIVRKVGMLQVKLLSQRSTLRNNTVNWLDDYDDLCRALKSTATRNFREWRLLDKQLLVLAIGEYGNDFERIGRVVRSKSANQVRQFCEQHRMELKSYVKFGELPANDWPMASEAKTSDCAMTSKMITSDGPMTSEIIDTVDLISDTDSDVSID